jgi:hypothetical protein
MKELAHIRSRLTFEGEKTALYFESLFDEDWEQQVYTTGSRWQVRQVLAHFISAELAYQKYIADVLNGGAGAPRDLDIDAFNEAETPKLSNLPTKDLIARYRQARAGTLRLTEDLDEADLSRLGYHPWFGEKELSWYLKLLYRHNTMHLQDVRKSIEVSRAMPQTDVQRSERKMDPSSKPDADLEIRS